MQHTSEEGTTTGQLSANTWFDSLGLSLLAAAVAARDLGAPAAFVFDEIYYVSDAAAHLEVGVGYGFQAHPPLGTWLVAAGMAIEPSPVGWRLASLLLGVVAVVALHRLALEVFGPGRRSRLLAALAGLLLISDGSWLVLSRTAMLDGPLTAFVALAAATSFAAGRRPRHHRALAGLAGIAVGLATAVKWSGALAVPIALVMVVLGMRRAALPVRLRTVGHSAFIVGGVAFFVYAASWVPFAVNRGDVPVENCPEEAAPCPEEGGITGVIDQHLMVVRYHTRIQSDTSAASPPSYWPLLHERVGFYRPDCHIASIPVRLPSALDDEIDCNPDLPPGLDTILYGGNLVVWFAFVVLLPLVTAAARQRHPAAQVALAGWALFWLPWLLVTRVSYIWYLAPAVPFIALGLAAAAATLPRSPVMPVYARATAGALLGAAAAALTPVPGAVAIIGWGLGGWFGAREPLPAPQDTSTAQLVIAAVLALAASVTAIVSHTSWTAG